MIGRRNVLALLCVAMLAPFAVSWARAGDPQPGKVAQAAAPAAPGALKAPSGPECKTDKDCSGNQFCSKPAGKCNGPGHCAAKPQICPFIIDPVCGCDKRTYGNSCFAAMAGVNVRAAGACSPTCSTDKDCPQDQFCAKKTGACKGRGECQPRPQLCPEIFDPVCGCDGKTYSNSCFAYSAGVSVLYNGECKSKKP